MNGSFDLRRACKRKGRKIAQYSNIIKSRFSPGRRLVWRPLVDNV